MEKGIIFAILAAICFAIAQTTIRKGVSQTGESLSAAVISTFTGLVLLLLLLFFTGDWSKLWSLSWQGFVLLAAAGIIHFAVGRLLFCKCIQLVGANKTSAITKTNILWTVVIGIVFLSEPLTMPLVAGVLCLAAGAILAGMETQGAGAEKQSEIAKIHTKGVIIGLGTALCWGISAGLIKPALAEIGSSLAATFISYVAASLIMASLLFSAERRKQVTQLPRASLALLVFVGLCLSTAQLLRYTSFNYAPISVSQPLIGTDSIFTLLFSFLINRNIEVFTWKVITGMVITVIGAFLITY